MFAGWYSYRNQIAKGDFIGQALDMLIMVAVSQLQMIGVVVAPRYFYLFTICLIGLIIFFVDTFVTPGILTSNMIQYVYRSPDEATARRYIDRDKRFIRGMKMAAFAVMALVGVDLILSFIFKKGSYFQTVTIMISILLVTERVIGNVQGLWLIIPGFGFALSQSFLLLIIPETDSNKEKRDRTKASVKFLLKANVLRSIYTVSNVFLLVQLWQHMNI